MNAEKDKIDTLRPFKEYRKMRQEAINKLLNCQQFNEDYCIVDKIRVRIDEKDSILNLLQDDYEYFRVPLPLYFTNMFWRTLKIESNRRICHIIMKDMSVKRKCSRKKQKTLKSRLLTFNSSNTDFFGYLKSYNGLVNQTRRKQIIAF